MNIKEIYIDSPISRDWEVGQRIYYRICKRANGAKPEPGITNVMPARQAAYPNES